MLELLKINFRCARNNSFTKVYRNWKNYKIVDKLLDYVATHPNDGKTYSKSSMKLAALPDAGYLNENQVRSRTNTHIYLLEDVSIPTLNESVITISQIINYVMSSSAEGELASLFITARKSVDIRQTLNRMGWPKNQLQSKWIIPLQSGLLIIILFLKK